MAVEPKLSEQKIASPMEIAHPTQGLGESSYGATFPAQPDGQTAVHRA